MEVTASPEGCVFVRTRLDVKDARPLRPLRRFVERGHDAVTVREMAAAAAASPGRVLHQSKDGLRATVPHQRAPHDSSSPSSCT